MPDRLGNYPHFRLNFEQQQKRAKDLLKAARAGDPDALSRFKSPPRLSEAQYLIARDLRFDDWAQLKRHIAAMTRERQAIEAISAATQTRAMDAELRTLHIRCGSDIKIPLQIAGFRGDFYEHSYPYLIGPVREGEDCIEQRARFLVDAYTDSRDPPLQYEHVLESLKRDEQRLQQSADYERVVVWSEFDCFDQLVQVRLLSHYATHRRPPRLELIDIGEFPGAVRFLGLGQLPPEALRILWTTRKPANAEQLKLGLEAWRALIRCDPRPLAAIMRNDTRPLPLLAIALHRHLRELPSIENGLSFTEGMALGLLAEQELSLNRLFRTLTDVVDPLPGQGDCQIRDRVLAMDGASEPVYTRRLGYGNNGEVRPPWTDVLTITELGRAVLRGDVDFRSLNPPPRWVGGVEVRQGNLDWRWDENLKDAVPI